MARLTEASNGVRVVVEVNGFLAGDKGLHIHEVRTCGPPSFESAGGHFNPADEIPWNRQPHAARS